MQDLVFNKLYQASFHLLNYRLQDIDQVPEQRLHLTPINDYQFPKPRRFEKLDRPRPPGKAPLEWILENMD